MALDLIVKETEIKTKDEGITLNKLNENLIYGGLYFKEKKADYISIGSLPLVPSRCYSRKSE